LAVGRNEQAPDSAPSEEQFAGESVVSPEDVRCGTAAGFGTEPEALNSGYTVIMISSMTDAELVARAEKLQTAAHDFLVAHGVEERLGSAGPVLLVGSYVTGLMVWRDLDVCVYAAGLGRAEAWELVRPFVLKAERVRYEQLHEPGDRRHYFVLLLDGWKLDLSLFTDGIPPEVEAFQDELRSRLDHETRLAILRLKQLWHRRPEYPEIVGGFEICESRTRRGPHQR
jgi:hypothetical protein